MRRCSCRCGSWHPPPSSCRGCSRALGNRGDTIERQRRAAAPVSPELLAQALADPEIRAAIEGGHKIDAIKLVRLRTGLDLKGAKELVEQQTRR